jgi:hypothetical protein
MWLVDRLRRLRRRGSEEGDNHDGVNRRTLLLGAAASAGAVAAGSRPALAAPAAVATRSATATPMLFAQTASVAASDVSVVQAGEITDTDVQAVLEALDRRLGKAHLIDDLQVAMTLVDDFMGNTVTSGTIGQLGWATPPDATGTISVGTNIAFPGMIKLATGGAASGWQNINLGATNLQGGPVLMCEWRVKLGVLNSASAKYSCWFGLHNNNAGAEPTSGFYFRYTPNDGPNWAAVCAESGGRTVKDTGSLADIQFHRFRFTCDGNGVATFYIDSAQVAVITTTVPSAGRYSPSMSIRNNLGTTANPVSADYFALRYEQTR